MSLFDTALNKTNSSHKNSADEIVNDIGRKLPKKLRKKLRWKKVAPVLSLLISVLTHFIGTRSGQSEPKPISTVEKLPPSVTTERHNRESKKFSDTRLQASVERAKAYQAEIDRLAENSTNGATQNRVRELAAHVQAWTTSITNLGQRIEDFRQNKLIGKDLKEVPQSIADLEERLSRESDPMMIAELERTVNNRHHQLAVLEKLQRSIQMAEIKMESTLSMLGTIYSQILAGQSTRQIGNYRRLLNEIDEEVHTLQDHLEALEEVKLTSA
jgi:hypothetical protein